jgi:alcohol dehydrogenase, propanol-preferring
MKAWVLEENVDVLRQPEPLRPRELPAPQPGPAEILIRVLACGVCHTELDEIEGRVAPRLPVIPGHQVIGTVEGTGPGAGRFEKGSRVGVAWIYSACGRCSWCRSGRENICPDFRGTGKDADGGYAEFMVVPEEYAYPVPAGFTDVEAAPLLCAGAIGYRSLKLAGLVNGANLGLTGFGGSNHLVLKMARHLYPDSRIFVFARNPAERSFALELGAFWSGDIGETAPELLHAAIDTTPVWLPVLSGLANLAPGGRLVINAIRKENADREFLLKLDYDRHLWREKEIKSVANVCRDDVSECLRLAEAAGIRPEVQVYPFDAVNRALSDLKTRRIRGAKVVRVASSAS